jgi:hypothetical protein
MLMAISVPNPQYRRQRDYDRQRLSLTGAEGISRAAVVNLSADMW